MTASSLLLSPNATNSDSDHKNTILCDEHHKKTAHKSDLDHNKKHYFTFDDFVI